MIGYIYKTVHNTSGKIYIGKRQKPKFDAKYYGSGVVLKPAIAKYGREAFSVDVLEWCETKEELCEAEKLWIKKYRESGADMYNIADGGDGGCLVKWWEFGEERRKEIIRQNSEAHKGERNPMYGKHHPEETKERIRKAMAGCKWPEERNRKLRETKRKHLLPVAQIDFLRRAMILFSCCQRCIDFFHTANHLFQRMALKVLLTGITTHLLAEFGIPA